MRKKAEALAKFGTVRFERANDPETVRRVLDAFFKQKSVRMQEQGMHDIFASP